MIVNRNAFQALGEPSPLTMYRGAASGKFFHGKDEPSNMVAEGSFDPSTGLLSSPLGMGGDHDLQLMVRSRPMVGEDLKTYIKDITLMSESEVSGTASGNAAAITLRNKNGLMMNGDVHHRAYSACDHSGKWRYNGKVTPGYQSQPKPTNLPSLAGTAKARRASKPYYQPHPGLYSGRGQDQQHSGAVTYRNSHCEEPYNQEIVKQRSIKKGRMWGLQTTYEDGHKEWTKYEQQTGSDQPKRQHYNDMTKKEFLDTLDTIMNDLDFQYYIPPNVLTTYQQSKESTMQQERLLMLRHALRIKIKALQILRQKRAYRFLSKSTYDKMEDSAFSEAIQIYKQTDYKTHKIFRSYGNRTKPMRPTRPYSVKPIHRGDERPIPQGVKGRHRHVLQSSYLKKSRSKYDEKRAARAYSKPVFASESKPRVKHHQRKDPPSTNYAVLNRRKRTISRPRDVITSPPYVRSCGTTHASLACTSCPTYAHTTNMKRRINNHKWKKNHAYMTIEDEAKSEEASEQDQQLVPIGTANEQETQIVPTVTDDQSQGDISKLVTNQDSDISRIAPNVKLILDTPNKNVQPAESGETDEEQDDQTSKSQQLMILPTENPDKVKPPTSSPELKKKSLREKEGEIHQHISKLRIESDQSSNPGGGVTPKIKPTSANAQSPKPPPASAQRPKPPPPSAERQEPKEPNHSSDSEDSKPTQFVSNLIKNLPTDLQQRITRGETHGYTEDEEQKIHFLFRTRTTAVTYEMEMELR